jgi:hypothetical protein
MQRRGVDSVSYSQPLSISKDFCSGGQLGGSPEGTLLDLLAARGVNATGLSYRAMKYYTSVSLTYALPLYNHTS